MKKIVIGIMLVSASFGSIASNWDNSPSNWKNSSSNWDNSPSNWKNSSSNWDNSPSNWNRENGFYGADGRSGGYVTPKSGGGYNIYDNDGNRMGYTN